MKSYILKWIISILFIFMIFFIADSISKQNLLFLKYEVIDLKGDYIQYWVKNQKNPNFHTGLMDHNGKIYYKPIYSNIYFMESIIILQKDSEITVVKHDNPKEVILKKDGEIEFSNHVIIINSKDQDYIIEENGNVIEIENNWKDYIDPLNSGYARVLGENLKYGYINNIGETVVEPLYDGVEPFAAGEYAIVKINNKYGVIDRDGNNVIDFKYDLLSFASYSENIFFANVNNQYSYIDINENKVYVYGYSIKYFCQNDYIIAENEDLYGIIDRNGVVVIDFIYDRVFDLNNGFFSTRKDGKFGLIDDTGKLILEPVYDQIHVDAEFIIVKENEKVGLFNLQGDIILDTIFDQIISLDEYIMVKNELWALYDLTGNKVSDFKYISIDNNLRVSFYDQKQNIKYGLLNNSGELIFETKYSIIRKVENNIIVKNKENKYGVLNIDGKKIIDLEYDKIFYAEGTYVLEKNSKLYKAHVDGKITKIKGRELYFFGHTI